MHAYFKTSRGVKVLKFYEKHLPSFEAAEEVRMFVKRLDDLYPSNNEEWREFLEKVREMSNIFGKFLRNKRLSLEQSLDDVAVSIKLNKVLLCMYENGTRVPHTKNLQALIDYYDIKPDELLEIKENVIKDIHGKLDDLSFAQLLRLSKNLRQKKCPY